MSRLQSVWLRRSSVEGESFGELDELELRWLEDVDVADLAPTSQPARVLGLV